MVSYDETGNRVSRSRPGAGGVRETPFSATYDAGNRMLTFNTDTLDYDTAGNLIRRTGACGTTTYTWDARNQLTRIDGFQPDCTPVTGAFTYDYRGRRIEKTVNGKSVRYLYDGPQVIAELSGAMIDTTYLTGLEIDEVLARYGAPGERMLLTDALGSVLALTDPQGNPTTTYAYSAYGKTQQTGAPSENPVQYTGRENDGTGLYYYRARYYAPEMGRFISSDPIGLEGGLNEYTYALNNPILYFDSDGEAPKKYQKETNPNKRKGADQRRPMGERERNVGHPDAEEHSRRPKGNRPPQGPRGPARGIGPAGLIDPIIDEHCRMGTLTGWPCPPPELPPDWCT